MSETRAPLTNRCLFNTY